MYYTREETFLIMHDVTLHTNNCDLEREIHRFKNICDKILRTLIKINAKGTLYYIKLIVLNTILNL